MRGQARRRFSRAADESAAAAAAKGVRRLAAGAQILRRLLPARHQVRHRSQLARQRKVRTAKMLLFIALSIIK